MNLYSGEIHSKKTIPEVRKAYISWRGQAYRCNNPKASDYKYYGGKGIKVQYSSREFVTWWLKQRSKFPAGTKMSVDRIDSNKDYCFENIRLIAHRDNVIESNKRTHYKGVRMYRWGKFLGEVRTAKEAAQISGLAAHVVHRLRANGKTSTSKSIAGWSFKRGTKSRNEIQGSFFEGDGLNPECMV